MWGGPSLYDSTIRVVEQVAVRVPLEYDMLPGISAPQLLAARNRVVLNQAGRPVHITTARRLQEAVNLGQDNIVVMLGGTPDLRGLDEWLIWWGASLGSSSEEPCAGRVVHVRGDLASARARSKAAKGWVMDTCLLRKGIR